jgi:outer membrane lipoprotein-sorting protein
MNKKNMPEPDLDHLLWQTLKDDLPPEAEARMNRQFLRFKSTLDRAEGLPESEKWQWMRGPLRQKILAVASAAMIILGLVLQLGGTQSALAHSIEQLKVIFTLSTGLNRVSSMDCVVLQPGDEGDQVSYRVRWRAPGDVRVDMNSADGTQTLWLSNETVSITGPGKNEASSMSITATTSGPEWQPALEFLSPKVLAKHLGQRYGLMQSGGRVSIGTNEFLIVGREGQKDVEITVDAETYLPRALNKYTHNSKPDNGERDCVMEAQFLWNQPIAAETFSPQSPAGKR